MRWITIPTYPVSDGTPQTSTYLTSDDFKPERTKSWEVGADVRLWGNKLILNATYYSSRTYNQVFNPDISSTSTYSSLYVNAGRVDNKGVEVSAELNQNLGPVKWSSNLVYSRNRNKVVDMLDSYKLSNGTVISQDSMVMGGTTGVKMVLREGGQIGDIYVNTLKTDEHGAIWVSPTGSNVAPAKDTWIYAGNSNPSYTLSWRNEFNWKGLSLGFMFNARVGGVGVSLTQAAMDYFGVSERTATDRLNGGALVNGQRIPAENYYQTIGGNGARRHRRLLCLLDDQRPAGRADPRLRHPRPEVVQVDQGTQRFVHRPQPLDALLQSAVRSRNGRRHGHLLVRHRLLHAAEYAQPRILGKSDLLTSTLQSYEKS